MTPPILRVAPLTGEHTDLLLADNVALRELVASIDQAIDQGMSFPVETIANVSRVHPEHCSAIALIGVEAPCL